MCTIQVFRTEPMCSESGGSEINSIQLGTEVCLLSITPKTTHRGEQWSLTGQIQRGFSLHIRYCSLYWVSSPSSLPSFWILLASITKFSRWINFFCFSIHFNWSFQLIYSSWSKQALPLGLPCLNSYPALNFIHIIRYIDNHAPIVTPHPALLRLTFPITSWTWLLNPVTWEPSSNSPLISPVIFYPWVVP